MPLSATSEVTALDKLPFSPRPGRDEIVQTLPADHIIRKLFLNLGNDREYHSLESGVINVSRIHRAYVSTVDTNGNQYASRLQQFIDELEYLLGRGNPILEQLEESDESQAITLQDAYNLLASAYRDRNSNLQTRRHDDEEKAKKNGDAYDLLCAIFKGDGSSLRDRAKNVAAGNERPDYEQILDKINTPPTKLILDLVKAIVFKKPATHTQQRLF